MGKSVLLRAVEEMQAQLQELEDRGSSATVRVSLSVAGGRVRAAEVATERTIRL